MSSERRTILLIDDVEENRLILTQRLEKEGFAVVTAANGKAGLEMLDKQTINLIFLDLNMPVMDGHTFLKEIKADSRYAKIPIIIITALDEKGEVIKTMRAGACGYLTKPFSMDQIRAQLDFCLRGEIPPVQD
jgi:DNA-binding response OmpR family regulator